MGFEDGSGEGVGVVLSHSSTILTGSGTFDTGIKTVSGAWAVMFSQPGAGLPIAFSASWSGSEVYITGWDAAAVKAVNPATINVYAKGNY